MNKLDRPKILPVTILAALWAFIFALFHLAWTFGWYVGLDAEKAEKAFRQKWFLIYDIVAFVLCVVAMLTALALAKKHRYFLSNFVGWACALVLLLHATFGLVKTVYLLSNGSNFTTAISFWDVWFCLGAMLFFLSVWQFNSQKA